MDNRTTRDFESWNHPSWTNPHLDADLIEQERERLPERVFEQEYGGRFLEGAGSVFRRVREAATGEWQEYKKGEIYYAGLDLARVNDFTVLVIMNGDREVVFADRFNRLDWDLQVTRIHAALERYGNASVLVDATGIGDPVLEALRRANCYAQAYTFTAKSKAALIDNLSLLFEQSLITLPRPDIWPVGIDELEAFEYSVSDAGNIKSGAPSGVHDDVVAALGLAAWRLQPGYDSSPVIWI